MNICNNDKPQIQTTFIAGRLYTPLSNKIVCIYTYTEKMVRLSDGLGVSCTDPSLWKDVTEQYCLQKVK